MKKQKMEQISKQNRLLAFVVIVITIEAILFSIGNYQRNQRIILEEEREERIQTALNNTPVLAKAISVFNIDKSKNIYGKDDQKSMPIASLAKIMTAITALNFYDYEDVLSLSPKAISQAGDYGLLVGEKWKVSDMVKFTLISSANDGAYALLENPYNDFLGKMNLKARRMGAGHSFFMNYTGLDVNLSTGLNASAFSTASETNIMAMYLWKRHPEISAVTVLSEVSLKSESGFTHVFKNTNPVIGKIPNLLFSKTGFTELAGGNLNVIFKNKVGETLSVTVLGSTFEGRFSDMEKIVKVLYDL
ncbi:hypothetical protein K8Q98_02880 [Candidatus Nomurabacteria bacterium]|nr:hypothetical protein [Candidatus Nomurabacteria bacterium]